jgi:hypothetical protein
MYVERYNLLCSCNNICLGEAIRITYSDSVNVALVTQHAMAMRHIFIWGLSGSTIFSTLFYFKETLTSKKIY